MDTTCVRVISECFIKPKYVVEESKKPYHLGSFELFPLSLCYIQRGFAFNKLPTKEDGGVGLFLERLKQSLSSTLSHFYPLAGQLVTEVDDDRHSSFIYIDCNKGSGSKFVHAALDHTITINDIVSATNVSSIVRSFFDLGRVPTNYDGHDEPLLSIQATQFVDGFFIGVSVNHSVADGTVFWHFLSSWSEIFGSNTSSISRPQILDRWFPNDHGPIIKLPYTHPDEFITRYNAENDDRLNGMVFHFSKQSILALKEKANKESNMTNVISSVQALSTLLWRTITRARGSQSDVNTSLVMMANGRSRLRPPLSPSYFGNFIHPIIRAMKVKELLGSSLGSVALFLHQGVQELTDRVLRDEFIKWIRSPYIPRETKLESDSVMISGTTRADLSDIEFGSIGKAVAILSGSNRYSGRVILQPGRQGRGSIFVELYLPPSAMTKFQQDPELAAFLS